VSRALAAVAALALAAILSLAPAGHSLGGESASAASCAWQQHSKRVVKRVKRNGRVRRVVHVKRWRTCDPLLAPPAITAPPAAPVTAPAAAPAPEAEPPPRRVSIKADDATPEAFSFSLSRPYVVSGEITLELNNQGQDAHNLNLRPEGGEGAPLEVGEAEPGEHRVGHFALEPGTYRLWCSLPQHEEWGMSVDLEVRGG
jgi:hypothetical protein